MKISAMSLISIKLLGLRLLIKNEIKTRVRYVLVFKKKLININWSMNNLKVCVHKKGNRKIDILVRIHKRKISVNSKEKYWV